MRRFFFSSQSFSAKSPEFSQSLGKWGDFGAWGRYWGVEILGEMGGGKCRFLGKSIDKGLQML